MATVKVENLASEIMKELSAYSDEITDSIKEDVKKTAKECVDEIRGKSPADSGIYKKGWKSKVTYESRNDIRMEIYNSKKPTLTHLLENGHAKINGGRVEGVPHARPAEENAVKKLEGRIKVSIK